MWPRPTAHWPAIYPPQAYYALAVLEAAVQDVNEGVRRSQAADAIRLTTTYFTTLLLYYFTAAALVLTMALCLLRATVPLLTMVPALTMAMPAVAHAGGGGAARAAGWRVDHSAWAGMLHTARDRAELRAS